MTRLAAAQVVRAVISYKWRTYASKIMVLQLCVYLFWVLGFSAFVFVLNHNHFSDAAACTDHLCWRNAGLAFLAISTFASVPFALIELCTIREYGLYYSVAHMNSAMDVTMLSLQYLILVMLALGGPGTSDRERDDLLNFDVLVAIHLLLLWVRLSQFFRCVLPEAAAQRGSGASPWLTPVDWSPHSHPISPA